MPLNGQETGGAGFAPVAIGQNDEDFNLARNLFESPPEEKPLSRMPEGMASDTAPIYTQPDKTIGPMERLRLKSEERTGVETTIPGAIARLAGSVLFGGDEREVERKNRLTGLAKGKWDAYEREQAGAAVPPMLGGTLPEVKRREIDFKTATAGQVEEAVKGAGLDPVKIGDIFESRLAWEKANGETRDPRDVLADVVSAEAENALRRRVHVSNRASETLPQKDGSGNKAGFGFSFIGGGLENLPYMGTYVLGQATRTGPVLPFLASYDRRLQANRESALALTPDGDLAETKAPMPEETAEGKAMAGAAAETAIEIAGGRAVEAVALPVLKAGGWAVSKAFPKFAAAVEKAGERAVANSPALRKFVQAWQDASKITQVQEYPGEVAEEYAQNLTDAMFQLSPDAPAGSPAERYAAANKAFGEQLPDILLTIAFMQTPQTVYAAGKAVKFAGEEKAAERGAGAWLKLAGVSDAQAKEILANGDARASIEYLTSDENRRREVAKRMADRSVALTEELRKSNEWMEAGGGAKAVSRFVPPSPADLAPDDTGVGRYQNSGVGIEYDTVGKRVAVTDMRTGRQAFVEGGTAPSEMFKQAFAIADSFDREAQGRDIVNAKKRELVAKAIEARGVDGTYIIVDSPEQLKGQVSPNAWNAVMAKLEEGSMPAQAFVDPEAPDGKGGVTTKTFFILDNIRLGTGPGAFAKTVNNVVEAATHEPVHVAQFSKEGAKVFADLFDKTEEDLKLAVIRYGIEKEFGPGAVKAELERLAPSADDTPATADRKMNSLRKWFAEGTAYLTEGNLTDTTTGVQKLARRVRDLFKADVSGIDDLRVFVERGIRKAQGQVRIVDGREYRPEHMEEAAARAASAARVWAAARAEAAAEAAASAASAAARAEAWAEAWEPVAKAEPVPAVPVAAEAPLSEEAAMPEPPEGSEPPPTEEEPAMPTGRVEKQAENVQDEAAPIAPNEAVQPPVAVQEPEKGAQAASAPASAEAAPKGDGVEMEMAVLRRGGKDFREVLPEMSESEALGVMDRAARGLRRVVEHLDVLTGGSGKRQIVVAVGEVEPGIETSARLYSEIAKDFGFEPGPLETEEGFVPMPGTGSAREGVYSVINVKDTPVSKAARRVWNKVDSEYKALFAKGASATEEESARLRDVIIPLRSAMERGWPYEPLAKAAVMESVKNAEKIESAIQERTAKADIAPRRKESRPQAVARIKKAFEAGESVPAADIERLGIKVPDTYGREGDNYVKLAGVPAKEQKPAEIPAKAEKAPGREQGKAKAPELMTPEELDAEVERLEDAQPEQPQGVYSRRATMTPEEAGRVAALFDLALWKRGDMKTDWGKEINGGMSQATLKKLQDGTSRMKGHRNVIQRTLENGGKVNAAAVDAYGLKLPEGYVREGDLYVFKPEPPTPPDGGGKKPSPSAREPEKQVGKPATPRSDVSGRGVSPIPKGAKVSTAYGDSGVSYRGEFVKDNGDGTATLRAFGEKPKTGLFRRYGTDAKGVQIAKDVTVPSAFVKETEPAGDTAKLTPAQRAAVRRAAKAQETAMEAEIAAGESAGADVAGRMASAEERRERARTDNESPMFRVTPAEDAEYMAAVEAGDMEKALSMVDKAAKAAGYNVGPVYHGTRGKDFNEFDMHRKGWRAVMFDEREVEAQGAFFSPDEDDARTYGKNVRRFFLKAGKQLIDPNHYPISSRASESERVAAEKAWDDIEYILSAAIYEEDGVRYIDINNGIGRVVVDEDGEWMSRVLKNDFADWDLLDNKTLVDRMKERGYDTATVEERNDKSGFSWFVVDPNQIKSADPVTRDEQGDVIPLSQRFNEATPDIRFRVDQTETPEFKRWFGDSKVVDKDGNPLVVYRGDRTGKTVFTGREDPSNYIQGNVFFSSEPFVAAGYSAGRRRVMSGYVRASALNEEDGLYKTFLSIKKPLVVDAKGEAWDSVPFGGKEIQIDDLGVIAQKRGHDGLIVKNVFDQYGESTQYIAFSPTQIKSATGNSGAFDPTNPDIRFRVSRWEAEETFFELRRDYGGSRLRQFEESGGEGKGNWNYPPFARVKKIWEDFSRTGFVRNERGMDDIADNVVRNIAAMDFETQMAGHSSNGYGSSETLEEFEMDPWDDEKVERYYDWTGLHFSDYAMEPLHKLALDIIAAETAEEKLLLVDRVFNTVHMASDLLAENFIEGGQKSLNQLAGTGLNGDAYTGPGGEDRRVRFRVSQTVTPAEDAEYMAAVEAGDMEKAQSMVDEAAKRAGYDRETFYNGVVDDPGHVYRPFVNIHTDGGRFGFFFTPYKQIAATYTDRNLPIIKSVKLRSATPLYLDRDQYDAATFEKELSSKGVYYAFREGLKTTKFQMPTWRYFLSESLNDGLRRNDVKLEEWVRPVIEFREAIIKAGYDSVVYQDRTANPSVRIGQGPDDGTVKVVFDPSQIKSADAITRDDQGNIVPLSRRFDSSTPDIRFRVDSFDYASYEKYSEIRNSFGASRLRRFEETDGSGEGGWSYPSFPRIKKIWEDFSRTGFVRDERGMDEIADNIVENIAGLDFETQMGGHSSNGFGSAETLEEFGMEPWDEEKVGRYYEWSGLHVSDYATEPLKLLALKIIAAETSEEKLLLVDRVFNTIHQASDLLAENFLEGGAKALNQLAGTGLNGDAFTFARSEGIRFRVIPASGSYFLSPELTEKNRKQFAALRNLMDNPPDDYRKAKGEPDTPIDAPVVLDRKGLDAIAAATGAPVYTPAHVSQKSEVADARADYDDDEVRSGMERIVREGRPIESNDTVAKIREFEHRRLLDAETASLEIAAAIKSGNVGRQLALMDSKESLVRDLDQAAEALNLVGSERGRQLAFLKYGLDRNLSVVYRLHRIRKASGGAPITSEQYDRLVARVAKDKEKMKALAEENKRVAEEVEAERYASSQKKTRTEFDAAVRESFRRGAAEERRNFDELVAEKSAVKARLRDPAFVLSAPAASVPFRTKGEILAKSTVPQALRDLARAVYTKVQDEGLGWAVFANRMFKEGRAKGFDGAAIDTYVYDLGGHLGVPALKAPAAKLAYVAEETPEEAKLSTEIRRRNAVRNAVRQAVAEDMEADGAKVAARAAEILKADGDESKMSDFAYLTPQQVMEIVTGYPSTLPADTRTEVEKRYDMVRRQMLAVQRIAEMAEGRYPSPMTRGNDAPDVTLRQLAREVRDMMNSFTFPDGETDPRMVNAQKALENRLRYAIEELEKALATGVPINEKAPRAVEETPEIKRLRGALKAARDAYEAMPSVKEIAEARDAERARRAANKRYHFWQKRVEDAKGGLFPPTFKGSTAAERDAEAASYAAKAEAARKEYWTLKKNSPQERLAALTEKAVKAEERLAELEAVLALPETPDPRAPKVPEPPPATPEEAAMRERLAAARKAVQNVRKAIAAKWREQNADAVEAAREAERYQFLVAKAAALEAKIKRRDFSKAPVRPRAWSARIAMEESKVRAGLRAIGEGIEWEANEAAGIGGKIQNYRTFGREVFKFYKTMWDFSALGVQSARLYGAAPVYGTKLIAGTVKASFTDADALVFQEAMHNDPDYGRLVEAGLALDQNHEDMFGTGMGESAMRKVEDWGYAESDLWAPLKLGKRAIGVGAYLGLASQRSFEMYSRMMRFHIAKSIINDPAHANLTKEQLRAVANMVNIAGGVGNTKMYPHWLSAGMSNLMWSSRLFTSQIQTLMGGGGLLWNAGMSRDTSRKALGRKWHQTAAPGALKLYARSMAGTFALSMVFASIGMLMKDRQPWEDEESMFWKAFEFMFGRRVVGSKNIDVSGGLTSYTALLKRAFKGSHVTMSGKTQPDDDWRAWSQTFMNFARGRLRPDISIALSVIAGKDVTGQEFGPRGGMEGMKNLAIDAAFPITPGDMQETVADMWQTHGVVGVTAGLIPALASDIFGFSKGSAPRDPRYEINRHKAHMGQIRKALKDYNEKPDEAGLAAYARLTDGYAFDIGVSDSIAALDRSGNIADKIAKDDKYPKEYRDKAAKAAEEAWTRARDILRARK